MDSDAVLARRPDIALVDELAHTNVPGSRNEKRWQDIHELLEAGIDVISTVNIQHLESLNDVVESITGIRQRETVPDWVVREADQVELVDMTAEALRRRMAHGNIYAPDKVDAALGTTSGPGTSRPSASWRCCGWPTRSTRRSVPTWMSTTSPGHGRRGSGSWSPSPAPLIRPMSSGEPRAWPNEATPIWWESTSAPLTASAAPDSASLDAQHRLIEDLGGQMHEVVSSDVAQELVSFARSMKATQLVLGATAQSRLRELLRGSIVNRVIRLSGDIDVHVISSGTESSTKREGMLPPRPRPRRSAVPPRRQAAAWLLAVVALPVLTVMLVGVRDDLELPATLLLYLLTVCAVAAIGGLRPAIVCAVAATLLANWHFTEPYGTLRIDDADQVIAIVVFIAVAVLVSLLVDQAARQSAEARSARAEAEALASAAGRLSGEADPLPALLAHIRTIFGQDAVRLERRGPSGAWTTEIVEGDEPAGDSSSTEMPVTDDLRLRLHPGQLGSDGRRVLEAFGARLSDALDRRRLEETARQLQSRRQADEFRTAILRAVSHDLRSPLASIKASSTSLLQSDIDWTPSERHEFAETIDEEADRLDRLIGNLLDMSRIEADAVNPRMADTPLADVIDAALNSLSMPTDRVRIEVDDDPVAPADPALLERVVANVIANALAHSPADGAVLVQAGALADSAVIRIVDRGPGIAPDARQQVFEPFQRLDDETPGGVGLGLAVAQGFVQAMGGSVALDDTPGGGLTVSIHLPVSGAAPAPAPAPVAMRLQVET